MVDVIKLVIAVRRDLDLGKGKIAAQAAHAAVSCALRAQKEDKRTFREWLDQGQKKIVVRVDNEKDLLDLMGKARLKGLICEAVYDAGHTQVDPGTLTCIGIGPASESALDELTGEYSLL
ncbi:MAG: peptidyl-tRNA hydrolase Pth2 [Thermoplasmataceae archaeon]